MAEPPISATERDPYRRCRQRCKHNLAPGMTLTELLSVPARPTPRRVEVVGPGSRPQRNRP